MVPIWCEDTCLVYFIRWANHTYVCFNYYISIHPTIHYIFVVGFQQKNPRLETSHHDECEEPWMFTSWFMLSNQCTTKGDFFIKFRYHEVKTMGSSTCWSLTNKLYWHDPCLTERWTPQRYALFFIYYSQYNVSTSREHGFSTHKNYMPTII
jgi:hypothetical protein